MTDTQENNGGAGTQPTESFGVGSDTKSRNSTPFNAGISKGILTEVKKEFVGKSDTKYLVLTFVFKDVEGNRTYRHSEFAVVSGENIDKRKNGLNVRLKHIYEAFAAFPQPTTENPKGGIGNGATSWESFFDLVATAFNTGNAGKPIFIRQEAEKTIPIVVFLKVVYDKKDNLGFPLSPNFIERVTADNTSAPKTIVIDKKYDRLEQAGNGGANTGVMGGGLPGAGRKDDDFGF